MTVDMIDPDEPRTRISKFPSRRSVRISLAVAVLLVLLYVGLMVAYFLDGAVGAFNTDQNDAPPPGGVLVALTVRSVDPVAQTMTLQMRVDLDPTLEVDHYESGLGAQRPINDLQITTLVADRTEQLDQLDQAYPAGQTISGRQVQFSFTGYIRDWPFDRYHSSIVVLASSGSTHTAIPVDVALSGTVQSWSLEATPTKSGSPDNSPANSKVRLFDLEFNRSLGTVLFGLAVTLVLICLPIMGLFLAITVYRGRRALEPSFLGWIAALLFATVPLRNFLPGSPPAGSWVDVAVVLWVLVGLTTALVFCLRVWWRDSPDLRKQGTGANDVDSTDESSDVLIPHEKEQ